MASKTAPQHGAHAHADAGHGHGHVSVRTYYLVFGALMLLMGLTVGVYYAEKWIEETQGIHLSPLVTVGVAMLIAIAKTTLIVLYFMHVKVSSRVTQIYAASAFVWLLLLFIITMGDYLARDWPGPAEGPLLLLISALFR